MFKKDNNVNYTKNDENPKKYAGFSPFLRRFSQVWPYIGLAQKNSFWGTGNLRVIIF